MEPGVQTPEETLDAAPAARAAIRAGCSCRSCATSASPRASRPGYLIQLTADVKPLDGPAGAERDFTDLHAWAEAYIPGAGWIGLDPTSGLLAGEGHIPLACTRSGQRRADHRPRPTSRTCEFELRDERHAHPRGSARDASPYTEAQWARDRRARRARRRAISRARDVRLTQGGEPTFVVDRRHGRRRVEHHGARRRRSAARRALLLRLKARFAPGGLLHVGQGKWYPGEPLPRWALGSSGARMASRSGATTRCLPTTRAAARARCDDAERIRAALARTLGMPAEHVITAYEDVPKILARRSGAAGQRRSARVRPRRPGRARATRAAADGGLDKPAGFVLPLQAPSTNDEASSRGRRVRGRCAASASTPSPAIRRSACGCRSARCRVLPEDVEPSPARSVRAPRRAARAARRMKRARAAARAAAAAPREVSSSR